MKKPYLALACASLLLVGAGCLPNPKEIIGGIIEDKLKVNLKGDDSVSMNDDGYTYTNDDGTNATFGSDVSLPADFPSDVPLPEGITVNGVSVSSDGSYVGYTTTKTDDEIMAFYESSLTADGWTKQGFYEGGEGSTAVYVKDNVTIGVYIAAHGNDGEATVTVTRTES